MFSGRKGEVAEKVMRAIKENEVYIFTNPQLRSPLEERFPRILAAYPQPRSEFHVRATEGETAMDEQKLQEFLGRALVDLGGAVNAVLMSIGDELGLYKALAKGPQSPAELARNTRTHERYIREWLNSQAAGGYVTFDKAYGKYSLSPEQELCLADPAGPVDLPGATLLVQDLFHVRERALQNFRTGKGMEWGEHHPCLFCGTERFFRAGYNAHLLSSWIPALDGVEEKLKKGGKGADVGCGHGASTILLAKAFPKSDFVGYD